MNEEVLQNIWEVLSSDGATSSDYETWKSNFADSEEVQVNVHEYLTDNQYTESDYATWSTNVGLKKKDESKPTVQEDVMESTTPVVEVQPISSESSVPQEGDQSVFDAEETVTEFAAYDPREESGTPESMAQGIVTSATNPMLRTFVDPTDRTNVTYDADATTFERSLAFITPDLIGRQEEEVVNRMKYHFTDYGFTFSQTGMGDAMIVEAENKEKIEIDLDPFTRGGEEQGSIELQNFLQKNRRVDPEMEELTYSYDLNRKKYFSRQAVDNDIQNIKDQSEALGLRYQEYLRTQGEINTAITAMTQVPLNERGPEFKAKYDALIQKKSGLAGEKGQLQKEVGEFQVYSDKIHSAVGNYLTMKEDDNSAGMTFLKAGWNNILSGITGPLASAVGVPVDLFYRVAQTIDEDYGMTEEEKKERYITIATDLGYDIPEKIEDEGVYNTWLKSLDKEEGAKVLGSGIREAAVDELKGEGYDPSRLINADGLKIWHNEGGILGNGGWEEIPEYAFDKNKGARLKRLVLDQEVKENKNPGKQLVRNLLDVARFDDVSEERVAAQSENVIVEGMLGLAQSAPNIGLGLIGRGKGPKFKGAKKPLQKIAEKFMNYATSPGAVAQTIGFSLLQTDALMVEMENDPDFKYVTEIEKKAITLPLAVSTAILETYGLRSIVANRTLMGGLMTQVTKLLPKGATPKMFTSTFKRVVESNIAKGLYSSKAIRGLGIVGAAATVEAETGGLQTVAEIGMKNVWNDMYEKEMFNTPEMWSEEFNNQVIRGALAEAVGGFVMGTPRALTTAFNRGDIDEVSDEMVSLFNEIRKDETTVGAYKTQLDLKVASQEMTKEEANQALLDFEVLAGAAASIEKSTELTPTQTKKALGLVYLRNKLEAEMDGMDPDLGSYKAKQEMLVTIKDKLSKIGTEEEVDANLKPKKDAIQESSTTEVDVQEQAEDGQPVGEGDTTGGVAVEGESETEVSPETTEEKVELTVEERAKQIEELVEQEEEDSKPLEPQPIPREQLESVDETVSVNKKNAPKRVNPLLDTVKRRVNRAAKAIKRIAPSVKIIMHESAEDFTAATGSRGRGTFLDNTIHINLENASGTTVAHEAFHAILLSKISTDLQAQQVTKRLMQSMAKSLDANSPLKKKIEEFVEGYDENIKNEERLAQVLGELSSNYTQLKAPEKSLVRRWIDKLSKRLGYEVSEFTQEDQDVVDLLNTLAAKVTAGVEVEEGDVEVLETEQGDGGEVGTLKVREQKDSRNSPKVETDKRSFAKFISNKDLGDFDGRDFVTNMYDFTTAGVVDIGNGITLDLQGGKSYVPFMMEKQGLSIGDVSNLAAFNTKAQAESFIRNSEQGNAKLFMPHAGTIEGSWQFQQSIFEQLMNAALDNKILSKKDIINSFNEVLTNEVGKKAFAIFKKKLGKNIRNFNSFSKNPLEIVELLNTTNNFSPELRKALNDKLAANKKYQAAIGVKSKEAFARKMEDPLNKGVEGGDLMGVVEFDNTSFEVSKPNLKDVDYHPSFAWTVKAKIEGIYQPTKFYKSYDVTEEYTKYNQSGPNVSRKAEQTKEQFKKSNVTSSAGSQPKVAKVSKREQKAAPSYSDDLMYQYGKYTDKNGELDVDLVLEKINEDIASLKNKDLIEEKLRAFEELIIPAISEDITSPALTQFEADVLMDPNATAESIERGFRKAKNIIDKEGSIDFSKTKESDLFKGGEINLPAFERFVDKNPEYEGVFNDWEKLFTESTEALLKDLNAFNVVDIELAESFKKQLQQTDIKPAPRQQKAPIKQTKREFVARLKDALQGEGSFAHMTAENPANKTMSAKENAIRNKELKAQLDEMGYDAVAIDGRYDRDEKSFFVPDISEVDAIEIGKKYGQESVAHSKGMLYTTGKNKGKRNPITGDVEVNNKLKNYYSEIQTKGGKVKYSVGYNFDVLTEDSSKKKPATREQKEVRFQKIANKFQDPVEIIKLARTAGFEDSEIKYFLQKTKKLKVKEINDLLKVDVDMFASMPAVFGNVPGGMVAGRKLYEATMKKFNSLFKKNLKLPKEKQMSVSDMINESIEFMMGRKIYKESTERITSKTEMSTLQQQLQAAMQEALGGGKVKDISKKIKELKKIVRQKIRGAREIRDVKRQLQRTIREVLPKAAFNKSEVRDLLRTIQDAEPKWLKGNLRNLTEKIESLAAEKNVSILNKAIQKILDNKFLVKVGGLEKLMKIDQATYKIVESIKERLYKAAEVKDDIIKEQTKLIEQVQELNKKLELTEEEETELLVLNIALGINNSKLMEDSNPRKADQLAEVYNNLKDLITQGRNNYKEAAKERSKRYAKNTALFHQALEGYKELLDFTDKEVLERIRKELKERGDEKASNYGRNALKEYFKKIGSNIDKYLKMGTLGLSQLSSALDKSPGAAFEGFIKDFVYRKVNESTRMYKESMMALDQILTEKTEEYLGKDYAKKIKEYRKSIDFLKLQDGKFFKNPQEVKDAKKEFDKDPTRENKDKLNELIRKNIPFSNLTPLQLQYLYFQYKQQDTHAGFQTSLGDNYKSIMDGLSKHFEETYPDLLELGRWQVEVLLPSLYEKYNEVYKKLYNTDLPQRDNYSGRTFRVISKGDRVEMEKYDPLSLLSDQGMPQMGMNVIGNSTKLTQKNKKGIMPVDAFTAIDTYLKDMEHFAAYAENINEISKVFFNKDIVDTIVSIHGQDVYDTIRKQLMATAQRGANQSDKTVQLVNKANNIFIVQKLAGALTVYLKQLTSIGTYGNFIGYGNWLKTATTMGPKEFIKAWKEISEESVYIKYRYWKQISRTIESYGEKQMETYTPGDKGNKTLRFLMSPIKAGDKQAIFLGGIPNYVFLKNKFMKQGMSEENAKKKAMLMFEEQTKEVQQSEDRQDRDSLQNEGGYIQMFNMFMSAPKAYLRQIFGGYRELGRNIKDGSGKGTTGENLRTILVYQFAMPMIFQWAGSGFPVTDWDEEDKKDMARAAILSVFNSIFVLGQILEMGADYATGKPWWDDMKQFPILDLAKDVIKQYDKTNHEDSDEAAEAWKQFAFALMPLASLVPGGGTVAAMPFKNLDKMRLNMKKIIQDGGDPKEVFLRLFNYSDYVIEGPEEKEKKPKKLRKSEVDKYMPELSEQMEEFNNDPDYKEMLKEIKDLKKEQEAMRQELLDDMFTD